MRVILKSGATFEFDAVDAAVRKDWRGHLGKVDWTRPDRWETDVYLHRHEVAAVIVTRARAESTGRQGVDE